jgi:hypothetical protein
VARDFDVTVVDARTGDRICDAQVNGGGPNPGADGGCVYTVTADNAGHNTLTVTHTGYRTRTIVLPTNECGAPFEAPSTVELTPE